MFWCQLKLDELENLMYILSKTCLLFNYIICQLNLVEFENLIYAHCKCVE